MTKLDALMERARTLPLEEQDALADEMQDWIDQCSPPDDIGADGSDQELARRADAWRANPVGTPAAALHERLRLRRDR